LTLPIPYPADTRAKGWRFELDHERIRQSDTWALAPAEIKPWLLMLWMTAWEQEPCGSLPAADELVAARIGMPLKTFAKHRMTLMRGWWLAEDGRLYHDTLAKRVFEMLEARRKNAERVAKHKATAKQSPAGNALPTGSEHGSYDTGTGTGTGTYTPSDEGVLRATPGEACKAMREAGMADVNPSNPRLRALLDAGITVPELVDAAKTSVDGGKGFAYALATAEGRRRDAAVKPLPARAAQPQSIHDRRANTIAGLTNPGDAHDNRTVDAEARVVA